MTLVPATLTRLTELRAARSGQPPTVRRDEKSTVSVQFNPTSVKLQYQHNQDQGGVTARTQRRQYASAQPATLSFDLEYDTAEEPLVNENTGAASGQVDVRTKTAAVRQFVEPPAERPSAAPPRIQFQWGTLIFNGIVTQVTEDLDYFADDGTPLRAKVSLSITEQNLKFEGNASGPGARDDGAATHPGAALDRASTGPPPGSDTQPGAEPGRSGTRRPQRVLPAIDGESVQQLATRAGGNSAAWRSLMNGLSSPLAIAGGTPVDIGAELEQAATFGRAAGFAAGAVVSGIEGLAAVLGLGPPPTLAPPPDGAAGVVAAAAGAGAGAEVAGFAVSAAGGLGAATTRVLADQAARREAAARASFDVPPPRLVDGDPLDARAVTYGRAIPLRARAHPPTVDDLAAGGRRSLAARAAPAELSPVGGPGEAPWERLPAASAGRAAATRAQRDRDARPSTMRWRPGGVCS